MGKTLLISALFCLLSGFPFRAAAQNIAGSEEEEQRPNAVENIMESSAGNVEIIVDPSLLDKILTPPEVHKKQSGAHQSPKLGYNKVQGYRIQVFSDGGNQHSLESRAKARGNVIVAKFPKYRGQIYTFSSSPNWFTRVGNFRTQNEANDALAELRRAFPAFANEMRVVRSQVTILK